MSLFRKRINAEDFAFDIMRAGFDGVNELFEAGGIRKFVDEKFLPDKFSRRNTRDFLIFTTSLGFMALSNLFPGSIRSRIKKTCLEYLVNITYSDVDSIAADVSFYTNKFNEDIKAGINPFDSAGVLYTVAERMGMNKTVMVGGQKVFSPFLTAQLGSLANAYAGMWKQMKSKYKVV